MSDFRKRMNKKLKSEAFFSFEGDQRVEVQPIPTGIPSLDYALGIGGFPIGRVIEIYGPESSGKTTIALQLISKFQELAKDPNHPFYQRREVAYIDAEHALDPLHVKKLGVDISEETGMLINQPDHGEQALDIVESSILSGEVGIVVIDSVAALVPKKEIEGTNEDNHVGLQARMISQGLRKITAAANKNNCLVVFINQLREKVGVMYGNPETTPGGRALKFFASIRMEVRKKEIKKSDVTIGQTMNFSIKKNKVAKPFTKTEVDYYYDTLFDLEKDIMNLAIDMEIIKRAGAWYFFGESTKNPQEDAQGNKLKFQGRESLEIVLKENPPLFEYTNNLVQGFIPRDAQYVDEQADDETESEEILEQLEV